MTKPLIYIGQESREMTEAEFDQYQKDLVDFAKIEADRAAKKAAKDAALAKLGLNAEEIAALFG